MILSLKHLLCWALQAHHTWLEFFHLSIVLARHQQHATIYILGVKLSLGIPVAAERRKVNLTQLRWNTRTKSHKKTGRKRPRPGT